jgi:uncharacterized protein YggT (Ycf19 family)
MDHHPIDVDPVRPHEVASTQTIHRSTFIALIPNGRKENQMSHITDTGRVRQITGRPLDLEPAHVNQEILHRVTGLISLGVTLLNSLICIRFLLVLVDANRANEFAQFIVSTTEPFLAVFQGLTRSPSFNEITVELTTLIAITVYSLLAWSIVQLLRTLFAHPQ